MSAIPFLHLDHLKPEGHLISLLPRELAHLYHAVPVATNGYKVTVAMAHPEDAIASAAVSSAIGTPICLVQADVEDIDQKLAECWQQVTESPLRIFVFAWNTETNIDSPIHTYSQSMAGLLQAEVKLVSFTWRGPKSFDSVGREAEAFQPNLIIFKIPDSPVVKQLTIDFSIHKIVDRFNASTLILKNTRWPLHQILLAIQNGNESNESALNWVIRLANCSHAKVTVLPLLPPVPLIYGTLIHHTLPALLTSNDPLGKKLRWIAKRLSTEEIRGAFKIREGPPLEQLRYEILGSDVDLVVINAEPKNHLWRWLLGEVVNNLYDWFDRPLLITK